MRRLVRRLERLCYVVILEPPPDQRLVGDGIFRTGFAGFRAENREAQELLPGLQNNGMSLCQGLILDVGAVYDS